MYDVVIAGAGPVGLFLSCELRLAGLSVLVLESAADTPQSAKPRRQAGHFAGIPFDEENIDSSRWPYRLPNPAESIVVTTMERIDSHCSRPGARGGNQARRRSRRLQPIR